MRELRHQFDGTEAVFQFDRDCDHYIRAHGGRKVHEQGGLVYRGQSATIIYEIPGTGTITTVVVAKAQGLRGYEASVLFTGFDEKQLASLPLWHDLGQLPRGEYISIDNVVRD